MTKNPRYQTVAFTGMGVTPRTDHQAFAVRVLAPGGHDYIELSWNKADKAFSLHATRPLIIEPNVSNDMLLRLRKLPRAPRKRKTSAA